MHFAKVQPCTFTVEFGRFSFSKGQTPLLKDSTCVPEGEVSGAFEESFRFVESHINMGGGRGLTRPSDTSIRARKKMHPSVIHFVVCIAVFYLWVFFHVILRFSYVLYSTFSVRRNCGRAPYPRRTMALVCLEGRRF